VETDRCITQITMSFFVVQHKKNATLQKPRESELNSSQIKKNTSHMMLISTVNVL